MKEQLHFSLTSLEVRVSKGTVSRRAAHQRRVAMSSESPSSSASQWEESCVRTAFAAVRYNERHISNAVTLSKQYIVNTLELD